MKIPNPVFLHYGYKVHALLYLLAQCIILLQQEGVKVLLLLKSSLGLGHFCKSLSFQHPSETAWNWTQKLSEPLSCKIRGRLSTVHLWGEPNSIFWKAVCKHLAPKKRSALACITTAMSIIAVSDHLTYLLLPFLLCVLTFFLHYGQYLWSLIHSIPWGGWTCNGFSFVCPYNVG